MNYYLKEILEVELDPKKVDELFDSMGASKVKEDSQRIIVNGLENAREEFNKLSNYTR